MERLTERLAVARKALATLSDALAEPATALNRDASIQRFEYSCETAWKTAQAYLATAEGLLSGSPAAVIRACHQAGILSEAQARTALRMARDRNLTVHTYNEDLAAQIYGRLAGYVELMSAWLASIEQRITPPTE